MQETNSLIKDISKERNKIMGLSMISIMLFHQYFTSIFPFNAFHKFGYWGVEVFLFLSGMGIVNSIRRNPLKIYYKRRLNRLLPACLLCGSLKYLSLILIGEPLANLRNDLEMGWWSIFSLDQWFIYTIIILYLLAPLLFRILKCNVVATISGIFTICLISESLFRTEVGYDWLNPLGITVYTLERMPVFLLGMAMQLYPEKCSKKNCIISIGFLIIAVFCVVLQNHLWPFTYLIHLLFLAVGTLGQIALFVMIIKHLPNPINTTLDFSGRHSLELYLIHEYVFWAFIVILSDHMNPLILMAIAFFFVYFIAYICRKYTLYLDV
jgi:peptidoglycan/LPS O-acetylase OafA/YrhL